MARKNREISDLFHDPGRLEVLRSTKLLDTPPEESFDRLTRLAAKILGAPVAFISLIDETRDFYKSSFGFSSALPEEHAIVSDEPLVVTDAREHPQLADSPALKRLGGIGYAAIPLILHGAVIGSFCVMDFEPRQWTATHIEVLTQLAQSAVREIELHMALLEAEEKAAASLAARVHLEALQAIVDDRAANEHSGDGQPAEAHRQRVLIADDDPSIRALIQGVLSDGYEILEARDGAETLQVMRGGHPDLVLLDLAMPKMSGWDVLSARGSDASLRKVPVIVMSARRGPDVARALASGAYALVSKPFEIQALKYIVRNCLAETGQG